jgi:hypothetical protein
LLSLKSQGITGIGEGTNMSSMYRRHRVLQTKAVQNRLTAGLNAYSPPTEINDNFMSDCLDVSNYRDTFLKFQNISTNTLLDSDYTGDGKVYFAIADRTNGDTDNYVYHDHLFMIVGNNGTSDDGYCDNFVDINITSGSKTVTSFDGVGAYNPVKAAYHSMCIFTTEIKRYVVYVNSGLSYLFYYDYTTLAKADLPFQPKQIVAYANRIFAIDTWNKLWWSKAGDIFTWYGLDNDTDYIVTSADMVNSTYTISAQPDIPRYISCTVTKTSTIDTLGTIAVVGTNALDAAISETLTPIDGTVYSQYAYKTITSLTGSGWTAVDGTDKITFGIAAAANGYVLDDNGYWTLDKERKVMNLALLHNNLYIWSETNTYIFRGYDYSTFSLERIFSIGSWGEITVSNNKAYFMFASNLYEFNGENYPTLINHPVVTNGSNSNLVYGGIPASAIVTGSTITQKIEADNNYLYLYQADTTTLADAASLQLYYYIYDIKARSWLKHSGFGFTQTVAGDYVSAIYTSKYDKDGMYYIKSTRAGASTDIYGVYTYPGEGLVANPYVVTKAYNHLPSDQETLTDLVLELKGGSSSTYADITVYYSLTDDADDFTQLYHYEQYAFDGDVEQIEIPVLHSIIPRAPHYRLKLVITPSTDATYVYLSNVERRYRVIGRSR